MVAAVECDESSMIKNVRNLCLCLEKADKGSSNWSVRWLARVGTLSLSSTFNFLTSWQASSG